MDTRIALKKGTMEYWKIFMMFIMMAFWMTLMIQ